jgi:hypothetical protein
MPGMWKVPASKDVDEERTIREGSGMLYLCEEGVGEVSQRGRTCWSWQTE